MIKIEKKEECCGCSACYNICPKNAIHMQEDEKGFKYPVIDKEKCINCGLCQKVCPIINNNNIANNPQAYACYCKDEDIRIKSSSGGIFTLLATYILFNSGVVYGVALDSEFNVKHIRIDSIEKLENLRGSKYVQSNIGDTYKEVKKLLDDDIKVLFTGTPCQIEGLKCFLQKDYENLYTQDLICHGVPSPKVWRKYLEYQKNKNSEIIKSISFRNKDRSWTLFGMKITFDSGVYSKDLGHDLFMQMFLQNICLRDSCYACKFKKYNRISDITLADFWGINHIMPEMNDDKGTSLVIVNSEKGKRLFEEIKDSIVYETANLDDALKYNPSMIESVKVNNKRESFFEDLDEMDFESLAKKYLVKTSIIKRGIRKLKRIIKKIIKE